MSTNRETDAFKEKEKGTYRVLQYCRDKDLALSGGGVKDASNRVAQPQFVSINSFNAIHHSSDSCSPHLRTQPNSVGAAW